MAKRPFDIVVASTALFLLSPVMLVTAILIKCIDVGPLFYIQTRVGRSGRPFRFYKFRSMPVGTKSVSSDLLEDIKLSWIGRLIRRTNIDELPQLYNVIRGDMSIVGPRPALSDQLELLALRKKNGSIHCVPGLTGLAQVSSYDGMSVAEKAHLDNQYSRQITFTADISIILRTFGYLLKPPPKY